MSMSEKIDTTSLHMEWSAAPWDEVVCGFPVLQISSLAIKGPDARGDFRQFERIRDQLGVGLVSCRLPHQHLCESMLLEDQGFRFIEMMFGPEFELSKRPVVRQDDLLHVERACEADLPTLLEIAGTSFQNERFKMDPRLDPTISDKRYQNWVASSLHHPRQRLYVIREEHRSIAFFVTELLDDGMCYWHLNAISPDLHGQGYGLRVWRNMIEQAARDGAMRVHTSIAARNNRVLNLYARLGFSFPPPTMTFHWVRPA